MEIHRGTSALDPIEIVYTFLSDISEQAHKITDQLFGNNDGNYFVLSEQMTKFRNEDYYVIYAEDRDQVKHSIYFKPKKKEVTK